MRVKSALTWWKVDLLLTHWEKLMNEFIKTHGFSPIFLQIIHKKKQMLHHIIRKIETRDRTEEVFIRILEVEIKELQEQMAGENGNRMELKAYLDKELGFRIDPKTTSTNEYMGYIRMIERKKAA